MYNDKIEVANKIISDNDLLEIFQKMNEDLNKYTKLSEQESQQNQIYESEYQNYTVKGFRGYFKCSFNFDDDTNITVDNYGAFLNIFSNRLQDVKDMWVRYEYSYGIKQGKDTKYISQHIYMNIYEYKMSIEVNLSSEDNKMDNIYQLIKEIILHAPEKYDRIIKKKNFITNKIALATGLIPSLIICFLAAFIPMVGDIFAKTYIIYPIAVLILAFTIGSIISSSKLGRLYSTLNPEKKYAGYDSNRGKSIYEDDIDKYVQTSEIIIGKNINNIQHREEIVLIEKKYSKYIPLELISLLLLSIIVVIIGKII